MKNSYPKGYDKTKMTSEIWEQALKGTTSLSLTQLEVVNEPIRGGLAVCFSAGEKVRRLYGRVKKYKATSEQILQECL